MVRKTWTAGAGALAATLFLAFANVEASDANAQGTGIELRPSAQAAELTDEVVPVFVSKEVVQPLPESDAADEQVPDNAASADSLGELVAQTPTGGALSEELKCLAGAVYFESRGEPLAGQLAVAQVVINRAESPLYPSDYCGVVYQRAQFSFVKGGRMPAIRTESASWRKAKAIARIAHRGLWESEAGDALYFHANYVRPSWSRKKTALATIDTHIFYK